MGVLLQRPHGDLVTNELAGALVEGEVELEGKSGDGGGGGSQEALEGALVAGAEADVEVLILRARGGGEGGVGFL